LSQLVIGDRVSADAFERLLAQYDDSDAEDEDLEDENEENDDSDDSDDGIDRNSGDAINEEVDENESGSMDEDEDDDELGVRAAEDETLYFVDNVGTSGSADLQELQSRVDLQRSLRDLIEKQPKQKKGRGQLQASKEGGEKNANTSASSVASVDVSQLVSSELRLHAASQSHADLSAEEPAEIQVKNSSLADSEVMSILPGAEKKAKVGRGKKSAATVVDATPSNEESSVSASSSSTSSKKRKDVDSKIEQLSEAPPVVIKKSKRGAASTTAAVADEISVPTVTEAPKTRSRRGASVDELDAKTSGQSTARSSRSKRS
jgi:hypothetical protein